MPQIILDFLAIINLLGLVQGFLMALAFLFQFKGNRKANFLLGTLLLCITLIAFEIFACYTNYIAYFPFCINLTEPLDFCIGPLTFLYASTLINKPIHFKKSLLHFIPALLFLILRLPYLLQSNTFKLADVNEVYHRIANNDVQINEILWFPHYHFGGFWMDLLSFPFVWLYLILTFRLIYLYTLRQNESFWNPSHIPIKWLVRFILIFMFFEFVAMWLSFASEDDTGDIYIATSLSLVFYGLSLFLMAHSNIMNYYPAIEKKKYQNNQLDKTFIQNSLKRLNVLMQEQKPYLNPDLSLSELAQMMKISTHQLSQLLNGQLQKSFSDFIREYRIEELKSKLQKKELAHIKIEELAFESGFNSKSVFNKVFKNTSGFTPSEFRKKALEENK